MPQTRVLVVDDDQDDQYFLLEALRDICLSCQPHTASNGKEALEFIRQNPPPPTCILLDLNMPFVNGFDFLREFKKNKQHADSTVIVCSTSSHPRDLELTRELGAAGYITKPSDLNELKERLRDAMQKWMGNNAGAGE